MASIERAAVYGVVAEFDNAHDFLAAAKKAKSEGYSKVEAYSPYEVEGMAEVLDHSIPWLAWAVLAAFIVGMIVAATMQYVTDAVYALNLGGRPYIAWQAYGVITFEFGILFAGFTTLGGFLLKCGLPLPYHPFFNAKNAELASSSGFFICVRADDPKFNINSTTTFMNTLGALNVSEVQQ